MRLSGFRVERNAGRVRASADMVWEDCERDPATLYFEVDEDRGEDMVANPHAFLLAAAVPALRFGERRIALAAPACPVLLEGLGAALAIINEWNYGEKHAPPVIEVAERVSELLPRRVERAGTFFSGGIDSYATLRLNELAYPANHPYRIREGVLAFGLEQDDPSKFGFVESSLRRAAADHGIELTTVATNAYLLYRDEDARDGFRFWRNVFEGSALAAIAHSLVHRFSAMSISGTMSSRILVPSGSHMMLVHSYSSSDLRIHHAGGELTRLQKVAVVVAGDVATSHIRVCNDFRRYSSSSLNCGECPKCIKTKLEFIALDREDLLAAFSLQEVSASLIRKKVRFMWRYDLECYSQLVKPLAARGHRDIARVLDRMVAMFRLFGPDVGARQIPERLVRRLRRVFRPRRTARADRGER